jgi:hypothetical protein
MPVVRHQDIAAEQKTQPLPQLLQYINQNRIFRFVEMPVSRQQIDAHKKDSIRETQTMNIGHARRLTSRLPAFKSRAYGQKITDRGYLLDSHPQP